MYIHKFDNLDKVEEFHKRHNLPKLKQEETDILIGLDILNTLNNSQKFSEAESTMSR